MIGREGINHFSVAAVVSVLLLVAGLAIYTPSNQSFASAATNTTDANLSVEIQGVISVSVDPTQYNFTDMQIGQTNFTTHSDLFMTITNDGSSPIRDIYAHPHTLQSEQNNPLASGNSKEYAAARFVWIKNDSSGMYHVGVPTWNITESAGGEPAGITNDLANAVSHGFYRNATGDYLWAMAPDTTGGSSGLCNSTQAAFEIKTVADTGSNRDMNTNTQTYNPVRANEYYGLINASQTTVEPLKGHFIALNRTCDFAYAFRFDTRFNSTHSFPGNAFPEQHLVQGNLQAGQTHTARVGAAIPAGIPSGVTNRTVLTIYVTG